VRQPDLGTAARSAYFNAYTDHCGYAST